MSKNTSPQARPARKVRGRKRDNLTPDVGKRARNKKGPAPDRTDNVARLREFLPLTLIANVIIVSFLIVLALAGLLLTSSSFVALPASIAQLWLVANASPVASSSAELGFVPLLPAMGVISIVAWRVYSVVKEKVSLADLAILVACVLGVPLLLTLTALAMLLDAATVLPVAVPNAGVALGRTLLVHGIAMGVGMGPRLWQALGRRYVPDLPLFDTFKVVLRFWGLLIAAALVTVVISLAVHADAASEVYRQLSGPGSVVGLTALSVLYLPNILIGLAFVLLGGEIALADGSFSLFGAYLVPLPPLPILAAVPGSVWNYAWLILLVPLVFAALVQYKYLRAAARPFRDVGIIGLWSLLIALVALAFSTGKLGGYGVVGPVWWLALVAAPVWLWGAGLIIAAVGWFLDSRAPVEELVDEPVEEPVDELEPEASEEVEETSSDESMELAEPEEEGSGEEEIEGESSDGK